MRYNLLSFLLLYIYTIVFVCWLFAIAWCNDTMHVRVDLMLKKKMDQLIPTGILKQRVEDAAQVKSYTHTNILHGFWDNICLYFNLIILI